MFGSSKNWELQLINKKSEEILKKIEEKKKEKEGHVELQKAKDKLAKLEEQLKSFN